MRGAGVAPVTFEIAAHPIGGVRVERRRGLVEHKKDWLVQQGLGQKNARLLKIIIHVQSRLFHGLAHIGEGGEMHDRVGPDMFHQPE